MPRRTARSLQLVGKRVLLPASLALGALIALPLSSAAAADWEGQTSQQTHNPHDGEKLYSFSFNGSSAPTKVSHITYKWKARCTDGHARQFESSLPGPYEVKKPYQTFYANESHKTKKVTSKDIVHGRLGPGTAGLAPGTAKGRLNLSRRLRHADGTRKAECSTATLKVTWTATYTANTKKRRKDKRLPPRKLESLRSVVW